jgi:hypothetical protein
MTIMCCMIAADPSAAHYLSPTMRAKYTTGAAATTGKTQKVLI